MQLNSSSLNAAHDVRRVVRLVEAEVVRPTWAARAVQLNRVEGRLEAPSVVRVRRRQNDGERYAASVGENVSLGAKLCAISRIGSGELPPFGAFTEALSREAQAHSTPRCSS